MGTSPSKNNEYLVYGYVRRNETIYYIPETISQVVLSYFPDCNIYGIGRNALSEFGVGEIRRLTKFELLTHMTSKCDDPRDIFVQNHRFITKNIYNELYTAGKNNNSDCGVSEYSPDMVKSLQKIKHINMNNNQYITIISKGISARHTFIVFNDNTIHAFGWNQYGQFGNGRQNAFAKLYKKRFTNLHFKLKQISCGKTHTLFLTSMGTVFSCGMNQWGQCGIKMKNINFAAPIISPAVIPNLFNIISIASGQQHNLCIDENKKVWVFGSNEDGQCGFENSQNCTYINEPIIQETLDLNNNKIGIVECGLLHSLFIDDEKHEAYLCGNNLYGQIGNNAKDLSQIYIPYWFRYKDYANKIIDGSCGAKHTILITSDRNVLLAFGANNCFQCSTTDKTSMIFEPYVLTSKDVGIRNKKETIIKAVAGWDTTIVATRAY